MMPLIEKKVMRETKTKLTMKLTIRMRNLILKMLMKRCGVIMTKKKVMIMMIMLIMILKINKVNPKLLLMRTKMKIIRKRMKMIKEAMNLMVKMINKRINNKTNNSLLKMMRMKMKKTKVLVMIKAIIRIMNYLNLKC